MNVERYTVTLIDRGPEGWFYEIRGPGFDAQGAGYITLPEARAGAVESLQRLLADAFDDVPEGTPLH